MFDRRFPEHWTTNRKLIWLIGAVAQGASAIWKTVTGALIHITDALASHVKELSVEIEPQQSGSGDPSPDNVRPITGWTGCNIRRTGANLLYAKIVQGGIGSSGDNTTNAKRCRTGFNRIFPSQKYTASVESGKKILAVHFYSGQSNNSWIIRIANATNSITFTTPSTANCVRLLVSNSDDTTNITPESITSLMLAHGEYSEPYEPYSGTTNPISWETEAGTVYGGTLTVNEDGSCDVVADRAIITMDGVTSGATKFYAKAGATNCHQYYARFSYGKSYSSDRIVRGNVCSHALDLPVDAGESLNVTVPDGEAYFIYWYSKSSSYHSQPRLAFPLTSDIDTLTKANQFLADQYANGTPVQYTYLIEEPVTYHLESIAQITTLAGENNIWADVNGEITLTYHAVPETAFSDEADKGMADYMTLTE